MSAKLITLGDVFDKVESMSRNCVDQRVQVAVLSFEDLNTVRVDGEAHPLRRVAQRSLSARLGIPYQYLAKCPPDIQAANLNHWIREEKNEELFFRFDGEEVRAVFTTKYRPVDNFEVLERLDALNYGLDTRVHCSIDTEFMTLSIPDGNRTFDINGDKMTPGISIINSEVGLSSLHFAAFVLRLVCTNGMIRQTEVKASYRHISNKILYEMPRVIDKINRELSAQKHQFRLSMESPVDHPEATLQSFNRQFQLSKEEKDAVEWAWPFEMGNTMFHIVNAYTRASQRDGMGAENACHLQKVGGNILGMLK